MDLRNPFKGTLLKRENSVLKDLRIPVKNLSFRGGVDLAAGNLKLGVEYFNYHPSRQDSDFENICQALVKPDLQDTYFRILNSDTSSHRHKGDRRIESPSFAPL